MQRSNKTNQRSRSIAILSFAFVCLLTHNLHTIAGQSVTARAAKFDELFLTPGLSHDEVRQITEDRFERFAKAAKQERMRFPYVLHYRARVKEERERWVIHNSIVTLRSRLGRDDSVILDGGVRDIDTLEMWFVPKGADLPSPTPSFERSEAIDCPN